MSTDRPAKTAKLPRKRLILENIQASDFLGLNLVYSCEQCTHFDTQTGLCSMGNENSWYRQERNLHNFNLSGRMAFCRFLEID